MPLQFEYQIKKYQRSKNIKIKIDHSGSVIVTAPTYIPDILVRQFVKKNSEWVLKTLQKIPQKTSLNTENTVYIFGKKYTKKISFSLTQKVGVFISGENVLFNPTEQPILETAAEQKKWNAKFDEKLEFFLKNTARHYLINRTHALAKKMNTSFNKLTLRKQKTRWGSCSSQRNLNFNWQLVHFEPKIIDYVIIHELAHLTHMNHSKDFWELVEKYDPEYRKHVGWLKRNGLSLE